MKKFLIFLFPLIFCLNSCEEIVEGETLPYEEKLVVRAIIQPGEIPFIKLTKTLPVLEEYSPEKAEVPDANVRIIIDGEEFSGTYKPFEFDPSSTANHAGYTFESAKEKIQPGKDYKLTINWHGKTAHSIMRIPEQVKIVKATIDSAVTYDYGNFRETLYNPVVWVQPRNNESYVITYAVRDKQTLRIIDDNYYFDVIKGANDIDRDGLVELRKSGFDGLSQEIKNKIGSEYALIVMVHAFDSKFYEYFATRYNNDNDSPLSEPNKVQWNVKGDGIGMFTGYSTTAIEIK